MECIEHVSTCMTNEEDKSIESRTTGRGRGRGALITYFLASGLWPLGG